MTPARALRLLASVLCLSALAAHAEHPWLEVRSPHFRVLTDSTPAEGRKVANEFEQMRHIFSVLFQTDDIGSPVPFTIFAARDSNTFRELEPTAWKLVKGNGKGNFFGGWEYQYAVIRLDGPSDENQFAVFHEYTHSVMEAREHWIPLWLDEGIASFYGGTRFESNRVLVGAVSGAMPAIGSRTLLPIRTLMATQNEVGLLQDQDKSDTFYLETWAVVHYMIFGKDMGNGAKMNAFLNKLQGLELQQQAFEDVFGDPKAFDKAFSQYLTSSAFSASVLPPDHSANSDTFTVRPLTPAETEYEIASMQIYIGERTEARARLEKSLALDPSLAGAYEATAFLDFDQGKDEEAMQGWKHALALDPTRARSLYATTMMGKPIAQQTRVELYTTRAIIEHVTTLAPGYAAPFATLALIDWRLGAMQKAFEESVHAEKLAPHRAGYHLLTGHILLHGHQEALAADYARYVADRWLGADHNEAVELFQAVPVANRGTDPAPTPRLAATAKTIRGVVLQTSCEQPPSRAVLIQFQPDGPPDTKPLDLKSKGNVSGGFSDTFWWGEDHFSVCHHLAGTHAVIVYRGDQLISLESRDDLPDAPSPSAAPAAPNPSVPTLIPRTPAALQTPPATQP